MSNMGAAERQEESTFGFTMRRTEGGWRWVAFDPLGRIAAEGKAATKVEAAALVIRALART